MRSLLAVLRLVAARARRRPGAWLAPALGIALAAAFAAAVAAEGTIAGDQAARTALSRAAPLDRAVRVTWQGTPTAGALARIGAALGGLHLGPRTSTVLLDPVRLDGVLVRPAGISPLDRWLGAAAAERLGPCRPALCPMLLAGKGRVPRVLAAAGVRISVVGSEPLSSTVPLAFASAAGGSPPVVSTWDVRGLDALAGLRGVYRIHGVVAQLRAAGLHSWQLGALESRLARAEAATASLGTQFAFTGPFNAIGAARSRAAAAPRRLLLAGGGAIAALVLFIVLVGAGLRRDQLAELERLRTAGARAGQSALFVAGECGCVCAIGLIMGTVAGIAAAAALASGASEPVGGVLAHGLGGWAIAPVLAGAWLAGTALLAAATLARGARVLDALALAGVAALAAALALNTNGEDPVSLLLAPLCCLAAGVVVFRGASAALRTAERLARNGPLMPRLALVGLARAPALPALSVAFVAVSVGLGGFALAYRATLMRAAADRAADRVPLDAIVTPGPNFNRPLAVASRARWRALARGAVLPVRRTDANYLRGSGTVTVPALGVPPAALAHIRGWRASDGSAPLPELARRLRSRGAVRVPGPALPGAARWLTLRAHSPDLDLAVIGDLRDPAGTIRRVPLGTAGPRARILRARLPRGRWELEALELDEPVGLDITNGHQNGENPAAATQQQARVALGPVLASGADGRTLLDAPLGGWLGAGAASGSGGGRGGTAIIAFATSGAPGVVRPPQPSDSAPVPVLADPATAAASGPGGRLELTVDGLPVAARVVGTVRRFPTLDSTAQGVVVADEATLSAALDAQLPGQGRPDELWISSSRLAGLRAALRSGTLAQLSWSFRSALEHELSSDPIARGVQRTLAGAAVVWAVLAVAGLLIALLGGGRDRSAEEDLVAQGLGPRGLRAQARARIVVAAVLGLACGIAIAALLTLLAVASVRAAATTAASGPPLVTVVPWADLAAWTLVLLGAMAASGWLATYAIARTGVLGRRSTRQLPRPGSEFTEGVAR